MATTKTTTRQAFYVTGDDFEIGPFRSKEAALTEARALRDEEGMTGLRVRTERVGKTKTTDDTSKKKADDDIPVDDDVEDGDEDGDDDDQDDDDLDLDSLFDDDDEDDDNGGDDEGQDDDDEGEDEPDEPPKVTHRWFKKFGE